MDRVLIIEHDVRLLADEAAWLREAGFAVVTAVGRDEARRILDRELVDVVVCDLGTGGEGELSLLDHLRDEAPTTPVVVVTAEAQLEVAIRAMRGGAWDYLAKPTRRDRLVESVTRAAEHWHLMETTALTRSADVVFGTLEAADLVGVVVRVAREALEADGSTIIDAEGEALAGHVDLAGLPVGVVAKELAPFRGPVGGRATLGLPLFTRNRLHGELWLVRESAARPFTAREAERAMILAGHASLALDNANLVAELRERIEALERARRRMAAAERMESVGKFATHLAERLGTPLAYVRSQLRELGAATDHSSVGYALDGLARVEHIAHDLELVAGPRQLSNFELSSVVDLAVRISGAPVATGEFEDVLVRGNPGRLAQAVAEVLDNAVAHGGAITISAWVIDGFVELVVVDDGPGIPEDVLPHVTEPHFSTRGGSGLGLAVAQDVAEQLGGTLRVESRHGSGTVVVFVLPAEPVEGEFPTEEEPL